MTLVQNIHQFNRPFSTLQGAQASVSLCDDVILGSSYIVTNWEPKNGGTEV
jgi:hypothetical protein